MASLTHLKPCMFRAFLFLSCTYRILKIFFMGKGDKKTKKGKIFKGSFGKSRPAKTTKAAKKKP